MAMRAPKHADDVDAFLLSWAQDWLDDAIQNERVNELPYCARALEHLRSCQAEQPEAVVVSVQSWQLRGRQGSSKAPITA